MFPLLRSRDDSVENLFEDDEIVGDLPIDEGILLSYYKITSFLLLVLDVYQSPILSLESS